MVASDGPPTIPFNSVVGKNLATNHIWYAHPCIKQTIYNYSTLVDKLWHGEQVRKWNKQKLTRKRLLNLLYSIFVMFMKSPNMESVVQDRETMNFYGITIYQTKHKRKIVLIFVWNDNDRNLSLYQIIILCMLWVVC